MKIDRNNTNFSVQVKECLGKLLQSQDPKYGFLRYHQEIVRAWMSSDDVGARGLLVYHLPGTGKSLVGAAVAFDAVEIMDVQPIILLTKSLQQNFRNAIAQYIGLRAKAEPGTSFGEMSPDDIAKWINLKFSFVSMNAGNMMKKLVSATEGTAGLEYAAAMSGLDQLEDRIEVILASGSLDNKILIVDEAHNLFRAITNGSSNAIQLYNMVMRAKGLKIIFLTGTPISNDPFELVPCMNMIAGQVILPEDYAEFGKHFIDEKHGKIKNRDVFMNRIMGLVSHVRADTVFKNSKVKTSDSKFPTVLPQTVKYITMGDEQYATYRLAREKELEEASRAYRKAGTSRLSKPKNAASSSYKQQSRQLSNFCPPAKMREIKFSAIDVNAIADADVTSCKLRALETVLSSMPLPGYVYSQFVGAGGLAIIARYLTLRGWKLTDLQSWPTVHVEMEHDAAAETTEPAEPDDPPGGEQANVEVSEKTGGNDASGVYGGRIQKLMRSIQQHSGVKQSEEMSTNTQHVDRAAKHIAGVIAIGATDIDNIVSVFGTSRDMITGAFKTGFGFMSMQGDTPVGYGIVSIIDGDPVIEELSGENTEAIRSVIGDELQRRGHTKYLFSVQKCASCKLPSDCAIVAKSVDRDLYVCKQRSHVHNQITSVRGGNDDLAAGNNTNDLDDTTITVIDCLGDMSTSGLTAREAIDDDLTESTVAHDSTCNIVINDDLTVIMSHAGTSTPELSTPELSTTILWSSGSDTTLVKFLKFLLQTRDVIVVTTEPMINFYNSEGFRVVNRTADTVVMKAGVIKPVTGGGTTSTLTFAVISGNIKPAVRDEIVKLMNSRDNIGGCKLALLLISSTGSEGLDLKNQRFDVKFEPYWVSSRNHQVDARGARADSHISLPADQQNFQPMLFIAVKPGTETTDYNAIVSDAIKTGNDSKLSDLMTTDLELYYRSVIGEALIASFNEALAAVAIECTLIENPSTQCRVCTPTGSKLYTANLNADLRALNPCQQLVSESITAEEINVDGKTYYYSARDTNDNLHAYPWIIYEFSEGLDSYVEMTVEHPLYEAIIEELAR